MLIRQPTDGATGQFTQKLSCRVMWRPLVSMRPLSAEFGTKEDDRSRRQLTAGEIADINLDTDTL